MNIVQASFQASFDARVERLGEIQLAELRTMFRYFDTDGDGAVVAAQAYRMFALLGLDVNEQQVQALGEVYLAELVKIVDSHSPAPMLLQTQQGPEAATEPTGSKAVVARDPSVVVAGDADHQAPRDDSDGAADDGNADAAHMTREAILQRSQAQWEQEWKLLDTHRRGRVSHQQLTLFLTSCALVLPPADLQRFLECYGEPAGLPEDADADALLLSEAGFLKFRYDFTAKDLVPSDDGLSSSAADDDDDDEDDAAVGFEATDEQPTDRQESEGEARQLARLPSAGASGRRSDQDALSSRHDHLAVDPSAFQESEYDSENDEGEQNAVSAEAAGGAHGVMDLDPLALDG